MATNEMAPNEGSPNEVGYAGTQTEQDVLVNRIFAFLIDWFASLIVALFVAAAFASALEGGGLFVGLVVGYLGYFVVLEGRFGQTLGKMALGVVVVNRDGTPISYGQALVRNLLRIIDGIGNYIVGLVAMLLTDDRQRVGDVVADTIVVEARN